MTPAPIYAPLHTYTSYEWPERTPVTALRPKGASVHSQFDGLVVINQLKKSTYAIVFAVIWYALDASQRVITSLVL
jgi:hypothetical protein